MSIMLRFRRKTKGSDLEWGLFFLKTEKRDTLDDF
jgi:hypothetical protein